ncbi:MAG: SCO family protein [Acidiferrobacterales bacterium]
MNYPTHKLNRKAWLAVLTASLFLLLAGCDNSPSGSASTIQRPPAQFRLANVNGSVSSLEFTLVDSASNKPVTGDTYQGKYVLMYFGYTHCPDVCPTTLVRMSRALKQLGERLSKNIQILFITLDPARDSARLMSEYTKNFGPHIAGLRGTDAQIQNVANRYHVAYGTGKRDKYGNYEVVHGSAIYIFGTDGKARLMAKPNDPASSISHDLRMLMDGA